MWLWWYQPLVELPGGIKTKELLAEARSNTEVRVSYMTGQGFYKEGEGKGTNCMRLSFETVTQERNEQDI